MPSQQSLVHNALQLSFKFHFSGEELPEEGPEGETEAIDFTNSTAWPAPTFAGTKISGKRGRVPIQDFFSSGTFAQNVAAEFMFIT